MLQASPEGSFTEKQFQRVMTLKGLTIPTAIPLVLVFL